MGWNPLIVVLAFAFGVAGARTSLCCVAAMIAAVRERNPQGLLVLATTVLVAACVLLAGATLDPAAAHLPGSGPVSLRLFAGVALLAAGALVNGACYLGTALYLGRGRADFLWTLVGIVLAHHLAWSPWSGIEAAPLRTGLQLSGGPMPYLAAALACLGLGVIVVRRAPTPRRTAALGALAIGTVAGLIEALAPAWSSSTVFNGAAWPMSVSALAFFLGGLAGAGLAKTFAPAGFTLRGSARRLAGGVLMGTGAGWVPGGNDMLLTWAAPGLAWDGLLALVAYLGLLGLAIAAGSRLGRRA
jgi:hypothetical protein